MAKKSLSGLRTEGCDSNSDILIVTQRQCFQWFVPATSGLTVAWFPNVEITWFSQLTNTEKNERTFHHGLLYSVLGVER